MTKYILKRLNSKSNNISKKKYSKNCRKKINKKNKRKTHRKTHRRTHRRRHRRIKFGGSRTSGNRSILHGFSENNMFEYDDLHIITNINKLESYIHDSYEEKFKMKKKFLSRIFLAWMPESLHGTKDALFIIVVEINSETKEFIICHLVQSPFWDPAQIDSNELKVALENQNEKQNCTTINLEYLYFFFHFVIVVLF